MKFYPTQIESYLNCPRKYFYSRDPDLRRQYSKASPHLVLGNAVHDALEKFFDLSKVPASDRTLETLNNLLRDAWAGRGIFKRNGWKQKKVREEAFEGNRENEKAWGQKGLNMLYRFFQTQDTTTVPLTTEQFHELRLTDDVTLGGKIDRIDRTPEGELIVIDYKTGKPPWEKDPAKVAEKDLQLTAYALVVSTKFRGTVARCSFLYLNDELEIGFKPDDALIARKKDEILTVCGRMLADWKTEDFDATPNPLCGWCDFSEICEPGKEYLRAKEAGATGENLELPF